MMDLEPRGCPAPIAIMTTINEVALRTVSMAVEMEFKQQFASNLEVSSGKQRTCFSWTFPLPFNVLPLPLDPTPGFMYKYIYLFIYIHIHIYIYAVVCLRQLKILIADCELENKMKT